MSATPESFKLTFWKGATYTKRLFLLTADLGSAPRDLTGYSGLWNIKDKAGGTTLATYTSPTNITFGGGAGTIDILVPDTATALFTWQHGVYEFFITSPGSVTEIILFGPVVVKDI